MRTVKHKRRGGTTWCVGLDVHEIPDIMDLPVPAYNSRERNRLQAGWTGKQFEEDKYGTGKKSFYLGDLRSLKALANMHHKGWAKGAEEAEKLADGLIDKVSQPLGIRRRVRYGDDGDEFDKERLINGHLDTCWRSSVRQIAVATPIINIAVGWGGNAQLSHSQLFWSGASALALVKVLENAGYQTSLTAVCANDMHSDERAMALCCQVKQAGEYLRPDAVASIICHSATFRVYMFALWLSGPYRVPNGLGHCCEVNKLIPHAVDAGVMDAPQVLLPDAYTEEAARKSIQNALLELQAANLAALPEVADSWKS